MEKDKQICEIVGHDWNKEILAMAKIYKCSRCGAARFRQNDD